MKELSRFLPIIWPALLLVSCFQTTCFDGSARSEEPLSKERDVGENEEYWTLERMKKAKPLELPHPTAPPPGGTLPETQTRDKAREQQAPGSPGEPPPMPKNPRVDGD